ncbi:MAG: PD40 domain-containing protein [Acidobacteriia bacterium]|nr:PD40 domain-containing protein [Terriglobia bacterium]
MAKTYVLKLLVTGSALAMLVLLPALGPIPLLAKTIEFDTNEATTPGLSATPDGRGLIFNVDGHLFRLAESGGSATQLTFGPYYDSEPAVSPDGARIAFISNRDAGSDGNLFLLNPANGAITQLTHEFQVGAPAWSSDGKTIAFISYLKREQYPPDQIPGFAGGDTGSIMTVPAQGGSPQRLTGPGLYVSLFFLSDGRIGWTRAERGSGQGGRITAAPPTADTIIEARDPAGAVAKLGTLRGGLGHVALTPDGKGFYFVAGGSLRRYSFGDADAREIGSVPGGQMRLAEVRGGPSIFAASGANLWDLDLASGKKEDIAWQAHVKMEVAEPLIRRWTPPSSAMFQTRAILSPGLSPDGKTLVFMAAGILWEQPMSGGQARKIAGEPVSFECDPAFSPDGKKLAFVSDTKGKRELKVFDFATSETQTLVSVPGASWVLFPSWSKDGKSIVFQRSEEIAAPYRVMRVEAAGGAPVEVAQSAGEWTARPSLSADGKSVYFTARKGIVANFYRLALRPGAQPEAITNLTRHVHDGMVSPDGKWLAFRRNAEIWIAPMEKRVLGDRDFHRFSTQGGRSFQFTPDSTAIVYSEGRRVWKQPVGGGAAMPIPVHLTLTRLSSPPLLVSHVRVLDVASGKFEPESAIFADQGRIRWMGQESGHRIPTNTVRLDGGGRWVIPGITDSHVHTAWANQKITDDSLIAYGVTTVRDTGSRIDWINALKDRADSSNMPIPRYFASGDIFEGLMPLWGDAFLEIATPEEARAYVKEWKELGADFIKVYPSLPWYLKTIVAEEAHGEGMPVVGHGLSGEEITRSVILGFETLEHHGPTNDDIVKMLAAAGVKSDPTIDLFAGVTVALAGNPPAAVDAKFRKYVPEQSLADAHPGGTLSQFQLTAWKGTLSEIQRMYRGGVKMLDGTDALMTGAFFGPTVHYELRFLNQADIPTAEVLRLATLGAAETEGASADLGTLDPGKLADFLLLDGNPLEDINNTMKIWRVVKSGNVFDPGTMR